MKQLQRSSRLVGVHRLPGICQPPAGETLSGVISDGSVPIYESADHCYLTPAYSREISCYPDNTNSLSLTSAALELTGNNDEFVHAVASDIGDPWHALRFQNRTLAAPCLYDMVATWLHFVGQSLLMKWVSLRVSCDIDHAAFQHLLRVRRSLMSKSLLADYFSTFAS